MIAEKHYEIIIESLAEYCNAQKVKVLNSGPKDRIVNPYKASWNAEKRIQHAQRMKDMWARKRAEKEVKPVE